MAKFSDAIGALSGVFQLGIGGARLRSNSGTIEARNAGNTALAPFACVTSIVTVTNGKTLALTDRVTLQEITAGFSVAITVPPNSSVPFDVGTVITGVQYSTGTVTIAAGAGVTIRVFATDSLVLAGQYAWFQLTKRSTDDWYLAGRLLPA